MQSNLPHETETLGKSADADRGDAAPSLATRIDGPHRIVEPENSCADSESDPTPGDLAKVQASELAGHLRSQQRDLDRREAQLNARTAQLEKDLRTSRLWLQERERQYSLREAELEQQVRQLREQATAIGAAEVSQELPVISSDSEGSEDEVPQVVDPLELDSPEALLKAALKEIEVQRAELAAERQQHEKQVTQTGQTLESRHQRLQTEFAAKHKRLQQRSEVLDRRQTALDQLHAEASQMHQHALESRVLVQQVWVQLSERFEVAQLAQTLSQARQRLDDQYRLQRNKQRQQHDELQELAKRLDQRRQELAAKQTQLRSWTARRNEELEEQAARLVAREQELQRQHRQIEQLRDTWREEKHRYQQQICELAGRLSRVRPAA